MIFNFNNERELKRASGKSIHVTGAKEAPCLVNVYGNTEQDTASPNPSYPQEIESVELSEIKTCGKNLFKCTSFSNGTQNGVTLEGYLNKQGFLEYFTLNGTCTNAIYRSLTLPNMTLPKGSYVLSGCPSGGSNTSYRWYISTTDGKSYIDEGKGVSFTFEENTTFTLTLVIYKGAVCNNVKFYPMISVEGGEFEPYTESVATLSNPITLNGLNGVQDYVDVKRGVLVQKIKTVVLNGSESWSSGSSKAPTFHAPTNLFSDRMKTADGTQFICDKLSYAEKIQSTELGYACAFNPNVPYYNYFYVQVPSSVASIADTSAFKTWLASNPITVLYALEVPIETPLPEADAEALRALQSFDGITNVFNDGNAEMDFIYATTENAVINMENNKALNGLTLLTIAETDFEALTEKDSKTLYLVY